MPIVLGTKILDPVNVIVAMTIYTVALLVRTVADGLSAVPDDIEQAAIAMGYSGLRRLFGVDLPLAVPVIAAGLRVAAVSNVSIVSVASLDRRLAARLPPHRRLRPRHSRPSSSTGIVACLLLALALRRSSSCVGTRLLTPWTAGAGGRA